MKYLLSIIIYFILGVIGVQAQYTISTIAGEFNEEGVDATQVAIGRTHASSRLGLDTQGNLFICHGKLRKVNLNTGKAYTINTSDYQVNDAVIDATGNIYITDGDRINKIDAITGDITFIAYIGDIGFMALDNYGDVYVTSPVSRYVRKVDISTGVVSIIAGNGKDEFSFDGIEATLVSLKRPTGLVFDANNNLYIADNGDHRIRKVDANTGIITTIAGRSGIRGFAGDGGQATNARLNGPIDVTIDANNNLYIADLRNHRIRKVDANTGIITTIAGSGQWSGFSGDGGEATLATLHNPYDVEVDASGNIYISDAENNRVRKITASTGYINTVAGNGLEGANAGFSGDGGPALQAQFNFGVDSGLALDAQGNLYIADTENNRIRKIDVHTKVITTIAGEGIHKPKKVEIDAQGNIYILRGNLINKIAASTHIITTIYQAQLNANLKDIYVDLKGYLYIIEKHQVKKIELATNKVTLVAGTGKAGYSGDGGLATQAQLNNPSTLTLDTQGSLYIGENGRIRKVDASTNIITTIVDSFFGVRDLAVDVEGNLYASTGQHVKKIIVSSGKVQTIAGGGSFKDNNIPATLASLDFCSSLVLARNGDINIIDANYNHIRKLRLTPAIEVTQDNTPLTTQGNYSFGKHFLNSPPQRTFTVKNLTSATFHNQSVKTQGDFKLVNSVPDNINGESSITITVAMDVSSIGYKKGYLIINDGYGFLLTGEVKEDNRQNQSITFGALADKTYGDADFSLSATASSGLPVTYTSSNPSVAVINGSSVEIVGIGSTTITAKQAGNAQYHPAPAINQTLKVGKKSQSINFGALADKTYGDADFSLSATASSGLLVTYTSSNPSVAVINGSSIEIVGIGSTTITAKQAGNAQYHPAPAINQTLKVGKKSQSINFGALADKTYGDADFSLSATASSGLPVSYTSSNPSVAIINGSTIEIVGIGSATITAKQAGNTQYHPAPEVNQTLKVGKKSQSINFGALADKTYGDADFSLSATASSGLPVSYTSSNPSVAIINGSTVEIVGIGSATITAKQAGNAQYHPAPAINQTLKVGKKSQSITFGALADKTYEDADFSLSATASSGLPVTYTSSNPSVAVINGSTVEIVGIGSATITAKQAGNTQYHPAPAINQTLKVGKKSQSINFGALADKTYGDADFSLSATASSGLPVTYTSSNPSIAVINGSSIEIVGIGSATITAKQAGNAQYHPAPAINQTLKVGKQNQSINFGALADKTYGDADFSLSATASSGLPVTYSSSDVNVVVITDNKAKIVGDGSVTITAHQLGNEYYSPTNKSQSLTIQERGKNLPKHLDKETVILFPNPVQEVLNLEVKAKLRSNQINLIFYNSEGKKIQSTTQNLEGGRVIVPIKKLSKGQYQVIINLDEVTIQKTIIKQ